MKLHYLLILLISHLSYSQNKDSEYTIYLDENKKPISHDVYMKKCKSHVLTCDSKKKDSIKIKMVKQRYYFGTLDSIEKNQFLLLLKSRIHLNIDSTKTIIISHRIELNGYDETKVLAYEYWRTYKSNTSFVPLTFNRYDSWQEKFDSDQKKCLKRLKKENIQTIFMTSKNKGYTYKPKNFNWIESSINIHSIFKFPEHNLDPSAVIFLKPDGEYFVSRAALPVDFIKNLINLETWEQPKEDLANSIKFKAPIGIGMFRDILGYYKTYPELLKLERDSLGNYIEVPKKNAIIVSDHLYKQPTTCF